MAHGDAAGVNGSNRILSHGVPQVRMMPNGCLGSPVLVLTRASSWMSDLGAQQSIENSSFLAAGQWIGHDQAMRLVPERLKRAE